MPICPRGQQTPRAYTSNRHCRKYFMEMLCVNKLLLFRIYTCNITLLSQVLCFISFDCIGGEWPRTDVTLSLVFIAAAERRACVCLTLLVRLSLTYFVSVLVLDGCESHTFQITCRASVCPLRADPSYRARAYAKRRCRRLFSIYPPDRFTA